MSWEGAVLFDRLSGNQLMDTNTTEEMERYVEETYDMEDLDGLVIIWIDPRGNKQIVKEYNS